MIHRLLLAAAALFLSLSVSAVRPNVIPEPVSYTVSEGSFTMPSRLGVASAPGTDTKLAKAAVRYLGYEDISAAKVSVSKADVIVKSDPSLGAEHYTLDVTPEKISISAGDEAALMYALSTVAQLARAGDGSIASCRVNDYPRFPYRGLMLDVVRCYIKPDEIKRFIDVAAALKLNNLHLHLTDDNGWRLQIKKYPRLTDVGAWRVARPDLFPGRLNARSADEPTTEGGFYTQAEMRDLVKYAAERNINIIPEIEIPAHAAAAIASYPELACPVVDKFVGVFPGIGGKDASIILCAGKEETFEFIENVLDEVIDIFPSPTIHLGGDEANKAMWEKCPLCNKRIEDEHLADHEALQGYLMDRVNRYVQSKGRKAMGWDEVTYGKPQEDIIVYGWQGDGGVAVRDSKATGHKFIMTPAKSTYLIRYQGPQWFEPWTYFGNITLRDAYQFEPTGKDWDDTLKSNLLGVQGSLWSEFCKNPSDMQYQVFPRLLAIADVAWRPEGRADWEGFLPALDEFTETLADKDINFACSMYNLDHVVKGDGAELLASVTCIRPDVEVRYSLIDSLFGTSQLMPDTLRVSSPSTIYASTFKNGEKMGRTLALNLDFNKATAKPVITKTCRNGLAYALTNGLRASDRNSDFEWAGWHDAPADFIVDLGEVQPVNSVKLGTLVHSDICVAAPQQIYVYSSQDGRGYTLQRVVDVPEELVYHKKAKVVDIDCSFDGDARYIKIVAVNPGCVPDGFAREGTPTWMYFDEISVN